MIQTENIEQKHFINGLKPFILVTLPFKKDEILKEKNVTCVFSGSVIFDYKPKGVMYFEEVDNIILEDVGFNGNKPVYIYVFKGKIPELESYINNYLSSNLEE